jgi:hypothetical protein
LEQTATTKEECAKLWILALPAVGCMEEPNGSINANAESTVVIGIGVEAVLDSELCK